MKKIILSIFLLSVFSVIAQAETFQEAGITVEYEITERELDVKFSFKGLRKPYVIRCQSSF